MQKWRETTFCNKHFCWKLSATQKTTVTFIFSTLTPFWSKNLLTKTLKHESNTKQAGKSNSKWASAICCSYAFSQQNKSTRTACLSKIWFQTQTTQLKTTQITYQSPSKQVKTLERSPTHAKFWRTCKYLIFKSCCNWKRGPLHFLFTNGL